MSYVEKVLNVQYNNGLLTVSEYLWLVECWNNLQDINPLRLKWPLRQYFSRLILYQLCSDFVNLGFKRPSYKIG